MLIEASASPDNESAVEAVRVLLKAVRVLLKAGLEKTRVFLKKTQPSGVFWVFLGFFGFFGFFCPDERVFFSFTNTFGCIQTLNYNHSY
jgi:hypothetical protein